MWTIPRWGSSGEEYSLSMNTRVIWLPCRTTKNSRWEDFIRQRIHFESLRLSACLCVCVCFYWDSVSGIFVCFAPWEWCRAWRLLQAETTRRLSWSECGDDTSVNLRRTRPGGDEMVLLGDFKMKKQRNKRTKWGRSDRLRAQIRRETQTQRFNLSLNPDNNGLHSDCTGTRSEARVLSFLR